MRYFECSAYLKQQELAHMREAQHVESLPLAPRGFWHTLVWLLRGERRRAEVARNQHVAVLRHEAYFYRQGRAGEDVLHQSLARQLGDRFILLRGYTPPFPWHMGGDIDAVLVGPHGVTVFEVKAWNGLYHCAGEAWWYWSRFRAAWEPAQGNPTTQVQANAERVAKTLQARGISNMCVQPMVAISSPKMRVRLDRQKPPKVYLYFAHSPRAVFGPWKSQPMLPQAQVEAIWQALVQPST